jgi:uncharacterized RDD family membrane protein YckC
MAKLIMNPHSPARRDVPLPRTILSIGRDPSNDVVLPDAMVSRRHALIECRGSQFFLRDCNSSNGSLVNGDRVSERGLHDGDLVAIGAARLLFREELELVDSGGKVVQHPSSPRLQCSNCRSDYRKGDAFCRQCGTRVQELPSKILCGACGTAVPLPARFCNACGGRLASDVTPVVLDQASRPKQAVDGGGEIVTLPAQEPAVTPLPPVPVESAPVHEMPQPIPPGESASVLGPSLGRSSPARSRSLSEPALVHVPVFLEPARERPATAPSRPRLVPARPGALESLEEDLPESKRPSPAENTVSAGARCVATLVDALLVGCAQTLLLLPAWLLRPVAPAGESWGYLLMCAGLALLALLAGVGYQVYLWGRHGSTLGQRLLGIEVQTLDGTRPIGLRAAARRSLGWALSAAALGLGFLPILKGATGLHDRLAGTRVARRTKG